MALKQDIQFEQRTQDVKISEDVTFETMLLSNPTLKGLKKYGFYRPSPIQLHGIPLGKCGFDLLLEAKSGTGKTAVFTVITLEKLNLNKALQAIILAPTREIAAQICDVIKQIGSHYEGLTVEVVMGGLSIQDDIEKLRKRVHVIVGSPGRLKHLILNNHIDVSSVTLLVLDESDKLMEKSFLQDVNYIFSVLPTEKQVIMSSATYPEEYMSFIKTYVKCAQHVCPNSNSILVGIKQHVITVPYSNNIVKQTDYKFEELLKILSNHQYKQCLIFCNYMARVVDIHKRLKKDMWPAELLHGQQDQSHRLNILKALQQYKCRILLSTDLAARGIDASNVDLVINFEIPYDWQTYLHRIGRAGRFGSYGIAITILSEGKEVSKFKTVLRTMKIPIILKKLWTDKEFDIECPDDDAIQKTEENRTHLSKVGEKCIGSATELWELLTEKENKNIEQFQTFDALLKSYQEANEYKIHTFSDLLQSFENEKEVSSDKEEIIYKYITLKDYVHCFKKGHFKLVTETQLHNDSAGIDKENAILADNVSQNQTELGDNCAKENSELNLNKNETVLSVNDDIKIDSNDLKPTERPLVDFGLPKLSSNGLKDTKNISKERRKHKKSNKVIDKYENNGKICYLEQEKFIGENVCKPKQKTTMSGNRKKNYSNKINKERKINKDLSTRLNFSGEHSSTIQREHTIHSQFDYNAWYNRFKTHMKYVEYSFYIEEMSNL